MENPDKAFIYELTDWQNRLFGYLVTLLGNVHDAHDVLQETNVVLWRKIGEFEEGTDFGAWARKVAYFQALAFLRDRKRDRHLFDDDLLAQIAGSEDRRKGTGSEQAGERAMAKAAYLKTIEILEQMKAEGVLTPADEGASNKRPMRFPGNSTPRRSVFGLRVGHPQQAAATPKRQRAAAVHSLRPRIERLAIGDSERESWASR